MKTKPSILGILLSTAVIVVVALPFVSWILSAVGQPVNSLLSDDGLRWFFIHLPEQFVNYYVIVAISVIWAFAGLEYVHWGDTESVRRAPLVVCLVLALFMDVLLLFAAFHPHSPLISLTGSLYPSPFLHGLPFVLCFGLMLVAYVYGVLTRRITSLSAFKSFLSYGYERYGGLMVLSMLLSLIFHCYLYIFY
jgi:aminobenzoyl-glutamate transport protein